MVNSRKLLSVISDVRFSHNLDTHEPETSDLSNLPISAHGNPQSAKHAFETTTCQQSIGYKTFLPDTRKRTCRAASDLTFMSTWAIFTARVLCATADFAERRKKMKEIYKLLENQCDSRMNQNVSQHRTQEIHGISFESCSSALKDQRMKLERTLRTLLLWAKKT